MAFPIDLTAALTGTSVSQLQRWRSGGLAVPEISGKNPAMYSFRDLVAIRTIAYMRRDISLQKIRKAFKNLDVLDFTEHPSSYRFGTDGNTIGVEDEFKQVVDLVKNPGQTNFFSMAEVFSSFTNASGSQVVDFMRPRRHLQVDPRRMGGWPTIEGTRVTYDTVASLVDGETITTDDVDYYFPAVSSAAARDAISFSDQVAHIGRKKAV
ncbi:uncharacterized protein (DUF433 family)/DNA-binding transcriptional MerR regulator [Arthrobacter sp. UYCu511]|uniref:DUF433 domain-containing protein n=1 Tax=Arthrobacter sp. UYCu511 TaxID=3156337 RepID=UPI003399A968